MVTSVMVVNEPRVSEPPVCKSTVEFVMESKTPAVNAPVPMTVSVVLEILVSDGASSVPPDCTVIGRPLWLVNKGKVHTSPFATSKVAFVLVSRAGKVTAKAS